MSNSTHLYRQLLDFLRQYSHEWGFASLQSIGVDGQCLDLQWTTESACLGTLRAKGEPPLPKVWSDENATIYG